MTRQRQTRLSGKARLRQNASLAASPAKNLRLQRSGGSSAGISPPRRGTNGDTRIRPLGAPSATAKRPAPGESVRFSRSLTRSSGAATGMACRAPRAKPHQQKPGAFRKEPLPEAPDHISPDAPFPRPLAPRQMIPALRCSAPGTLSWPRRKPHSTASHIVEAEPISGAPRTIRASICGSSDRK
ncbi:hypothetical protein SAMN05519105_0833 [Rhodobacter sp. 24-YEA-8]|nr:hypothetical protein SAMN05519105_0833 [Rhodobacter sp. 24-YEA-8]